MVPTINVVNSGEIFRMRQLHTEKKIANNRKGLEQHVLVWTEGEHVEGILLLRKN
jgi:hypothetical protein